MTLLLLAILSLGGEFPAQAPATNLAVRWDFDRLEETASQKASSLRILDVRPRADYDRNHIPGAVWLDVKSAESLAARPGGLRDKAAWEAWLKPLGGPIKGSSVVYGENRQLDAARAWWLLTYLGVERVGLADGNYSLWTGQHRPTSTEVPKVEPAPFEVKFQGDRLATRDDVAALVKAPGRTLLIDARSAAEHSGKEKRSKRAGHLPAACRLEWSEFVEKDGRFLDEASLRAKLAAAKVAPEAPVVTHCQGGGRASVDAFVFERLGHRTRNYYLGWSDWGNADDTPIER